MMTKLIALLAFLLLIGSCQSPVEVEPPDTTPPGKRAYVWSIDSVEFDGFPTQATFTSMWGSSPTDVWGVDGQAGSPDFTLWHYDGTSWKTATSNSIFTDFTGNRILYAVWGSAKNDVWAVGRKINQGILSAMIVHYDGVKWSDVTPPQVQGLKNINLYELHAVNKNDLWAYGYEYGIHYDGTKWQPYKIADSLIIASMTGSSANLYMHLYSPWNSSPSSIYRRTVNGSFLIDRGTADSGKFGGIFWQIKNQLKTFGDGILSASIRPDGNLETNEWHYEFRIPELFLNRHVESSKNVFAVGTAGVVYHYNGADWKRLNIAVSDTMLNEYSQLKSVWTNGKEVFICDADKGIIYHGK